MIITIHQPEHLPWLGFFDKIRQADVFVLLDHVQFRKNYYQNRNKVRSDKGAVWLTVPVLTKGNPSQAINEVEVNNQGSPRWKEKSWRSILQFYRQARYWSYHKPFFYSLYHNDWDRLVEINECIMRYLLSALGINVTVMRSSEIKVEGRGNDLVLNVCKKLDADVYLSGVSGKDYLDLKTFADAGIEVRFQEFRHPVYKQMYEPFVPCLSVIDLLFNYGPESLDVIRGVGVETVEHVFE